MPDYNKIFTGVLKVFEKNSTCIRIKVAALIIKDGRIISTGWNGVAPKCKHCESIFTVKEYNSKDHAAFSRENEIHAEQNALGWAARNGVSTEGADLYISISPCSYCAKLIVAAGIKKVYYLKEYDRDSNGIAFLNKNGIICEIVNI
jgi:dCMP deaminase|tara:strand:+ start:9768 stop:10208 length:441 start_codon:yes stop_codon:yes gene_type:complete